MRTTGLGRPNLNLKPTVSILIPSYNHASFLAASLESVEKQTFADWEMIVVDDRSEDESVSMLRALRDDRIRVFVNESNLGTYGTLARALAESTGDFVAVLNSDDVWAPEKLGAQVESLIAQPLAAFAYTLGAKIDSEGRICSTEDVHATWPRTVAHEILPYLLEENRILASSVLFRRPVLSFRPQLRYSGDWVALLDASLHGPAACVAEPLSFWRMHGTNSFRRSASQLAEEIQVRESILQGGELWKVRDIPSDDVLQGLGRCARHLSALYVLTGEMTEARRCAHLASQFQPSATATRRRLVTAMPNLMARRMLHLEEKPVAAAETPKPTLLKFALP